MPPAGNIDDVIAFASTDIAEVSYLSGLSLLTQMNAWIAGMYSEATGIFKPSVNEANTPGQRPVTNWYAEHLIARDQIEGPAPGQSGVVGTSACIDAVVRVACAVKQAKIAGFISATQQTAVVTLYNVVWA